MAQKQTVVAPTTTPVDAEFAAVGYSAQRAHDRSLHTVPGSVVHQTGHVTKPARVASPPSTGLSEDSHGLLHRYHELEHAARHLFQLLAEEYGFDDTAMDGHHDVTHLHKQEVSEALTHLKRILHALEHGHMAAGFTPPARDGHLTEHAGNPSHPADFHSNRLPENRERTAAPK